jgi:hypothetical protein
MELFRANLLPEYANMAQFDDKGRPFTTLEALFNHLQRKEALKQGAERTQSLMDKSSRFPHYARQSRWSQSKHRPVRSIQRAFIPKHDLSDSDAVQEDLMDVDEEEEGQAPTQRGPKSRPAYGQGGRGGRGRGSIHAAFGQGGRGGGFTGGRGGRGDAPFQSKAPVITGPPNDPYRGNPNISVEQAHWLQDTGRCFWCYRPRRDCITSRPREDTRRCPQTNNTKRLTPDLVEGAQCPGWNH